MRLAAWSRIINFVSNEDGATTVDWVVLTAAAMLGCFAVTLVLDDGTRNIGDNVSDNLDLVAEHVVDGSTDGLSK
ncbi:hypothetical protein [Shimia ponticola]|uniref:hypothetical protein n=1 Tax=Shimia ponticola TaxID=2582893 RepID=UPI0011BEBBEC|nr:hypothetical protein [Shimia ponticola]